MNLEVLHNTVVFAKTQGLEDVAFEAGYCSQGPLVGTGRDRDQRDTAIL